MIEIIVGQNNLEKAMRVLKRKLIREGVFKELKSRRFYEKPSEKRKRKTKEAQKKRRKDIDRARRFTQ
jgi:small subunit ribosomal protein S21